ncbi:RsmB/NOP family class I SAM-dependent RNA methyltransferase [Lentibacter sp. XHP0401]|uniref:RsmB/NOP family class I SAM-dependent RNA methyltransferase n=1 Tax=Lentibacter sp. XHP0401 TaxID=2984334 RepID=UPI0021E94ED2|nr:RsmB/NOP family class I SAM-dependent RNA methyltransferase [Lentibacter sp. XHP0401]MCV2894823.1 RsmB/NOP family class I SAM-dependent RNA methyltransferase [Lentibacter sp. XHP0401]
MPTPRQAALSMLNQVLNEGRLLSESAALRALEGLDGASKARAMRLANETLRNLERADKILKPHLRKAPAPYVMNLLRLSTIELAHGGDAHGVVNEAVTLVSRHKKYGAMKGLVNAVLRKVAAEAPEKVKILRAPRLPKWLRGPLAQAYSAEIVGAMEAAHLAGAPLDLSVKSDPETWAQKLGGTLTPFGSVRLADAGQVTALEGFEAGDWWVQDTAAALPAKLLNARSGETVLDMCCAPGGKTMQLANTGATVTALDASEARFARVTENLARTHLKAKVLCEDALTHEGTYDAVLLDAPCSATGTLRRHPDLPHAKTGDDFGALIELQAQMLAHASTLVKSGGRLVFCTCSLLPDEGEVQIEDFLETHPEFTADTSVLAHDGINPEWITEEGGLRLRPDYFSEIGGMDGFYIAVLNRA